MELKKPDDYAGFAQPELEKSYPGATALFFRDVEQTKISYPLEQ